MSTLKEKIDIMQQCEAGAAIEWRIKGTIKWLNIPHTPSWDWNANEYRVKPDTKALPFIAGMVAEEQCALIKHFAEGGTVKRMPVKLRNVIGVAWEVMGLGDNFNFDYYEYRIVKDTPAYIRKQKEAAAKVNTEKVQLLAWFTGTTIVYRTIPDSFACKQSGYRRVPGEDKLVEIQNDG